MNIKIKIIYSSIISNFIFEMKYFQVCFAGEEYENRN